MHPHRDHELDPLDHMARALARVEANLEHLPEAIRQNVATELWGRIPTIVNESATQTLSGAGVLTVPAAFSSPVVIENIVVAVPTGATGLLTLGAETMPFPGGTVTAIAVKKLLVANDVRQLAISAAGTAAVWLMGTVAPTIGIVR